MLENIKSFSRRKPILPKEEVDGKEGAYHERHDLPNNPWRRERVTSKVMIVTAGFLGLLCVLQSIAIIELLPLYKVVPFFVTFSDKSDQIVRIEPSTGRLTSMAIINEQLVKQYVTDRNKITADTAETIDRWGTRVRLMSSEKVFSDFQDEMKGVYDRIRRGNMTREITIKSVIAQAPGLYQVDFDTFDHVQGTGLSDTTDQQLSWIALVRFNYIPKMVSYDQRGLNPFGFSVSEYSVSRKRG